MDTTRSRLVATLTSKGLDIYKSDRHRPDAVNFSELLEEYRRCVREQVPTALENMAPTLQRQWSEFLTKTCNRDQLKVLL